MSFVLRRVTSDHLSSDQILGDDYTKYYDDRRLDEKGNAIEGTEGVVGQKYFEIIKDKGYDPDLIHLILMADFGRKIVPCYKKSNYFIMLNGATHTAIKAFHD